MTGTKTRAQAARRRAARAGTADRFAAALKAVAEEPGEEEEIEDESEEESAEGDDPEDCAEGDAPEEEAEGEDDEEAAESDEEQEPSARSPLFRRGARAERRRIARILKSKAAAARPQAALALALDTGMSASRVATILASMPPEARPLAKGGARDGDSGFAAAMGRAGNPALGTGAGDAATGSKNLLVDRMRLRVAPSAGQAR